jgi:hypothetical protein
LSQFEAATDNENETPEDEVLQDPLLELLRRATTMQQDDFLEELHRQRSGESVTT